MLEDTSYENVTIHLKRRYI